jgi:Skp family chaperone for outer membrane proteins
MKPKRDKVLVVILVFATIISTAQTALSLSDYWDANSQTDLTMAVLFAISALFYICILIRHFVSTS